MKAKTEDCPLCSEQKVSLDESQDTSWVRCDVCRQWFHSLCVSLTSFQLSQIASFHCPECEADHGPSHLKRQLKRARVKIDYVALDQGETFAVDKSLHPHVPSFLLFEGDPSVEVLKSSDLTKDYALALGLRKPVLIPSVTSECGLILPCPRKEVTVKYIAEKTGRDEHVEVMDVLSQQGESPAWNLGQWQAYFYTPKAQRDRIRNVISLEVSQVEDLGKAFRRPAMVAELDLVDKVWCDSDGHGQERPQVAIYTLMSVLGSYTDFHIDFSGTPVYYTVCKGSKTFLMYPPSETNLALYESWCHEPQQNFTWFGSYKKRINGKQCIPSGGFKIELKDGDLFMIPSGWIHSVYTPQDAVIIGGNYLTLRDLPMHLKIYDLEKRTRVPLKYRFPMFNKVLWLTSWYYYNHKDEFWLDLAPPESQIETPAFPKMEVKTEEKILNEPAGDSEPGLGPAGNSGSSLQVAAELMELGKQVLGGLIAHLKEHYHTSKTTPVAKKSIPTKLIGRNVEDYLAALQAWEDSLCV